MATLHCFSSSNNKRWSWSSALSSETPSLLVKGFLENKFSVQCLKGKCICHENDDNESEVLKSNCRRTSTTTEWVPITLSRKGNTLYYDDFIWQSSSFQRDFETPFKNSWHDTFQHFLCYTRVPFISNEGDLFIEPQKKSWIPVNSISSQKSNCLQSNLCKWDIMFKNCYQKVSF